MCLRIEEDGGNLTPACTLLFAIERTDLEGQARALGCSELQTAQFWPCVLSRKAAVEALKAVQSRAEIGVERDQKCVASDGEAFDQPEPVAARRIVQ